jgi:hypothetical protein
MDRIPNGLINMGKPLQLDYENLHLRILKNSQNIRQRSFELLIFMDFHEDKSSYSEDKTYSWLLYLCTLKFSKINFIEPGTKSRCIFDLD